MTEQHDFEIAPDGTIRAVHSDELHDVARDMGATITNVERLSNVEWETIGTESGWSVRSAREPELALRMVERDGAIACAATKELGLIILFHNRADALKAERRFAWDLR